MSSEQFAIVAEYRNVAVLERAGDVRAVWEGQEYFTDGSTYIFLRAGKAIAFGNEKQAKIFIDAVWDFPNELDQNMAQADVGDIAELLKSGMMDYREVYRAIMKKTFEGTVPTYVFDDKSGVFVLVRGVADGQHRHKGWKKK